MTGLPTGTLTLLFSDIEGSTVLLHRLGAQWGDALSSQRTILRAAFAQHDGTEMGTEGDSFFVVFRSAQQALSAAIAAQRGMHDHPWPDGTIVRVRIGLHTGEPQRHEDGYVGEDVHRAARIGSTANGGQIVMSAATRRLVDNVPGVEIRDLGHHRLKDLPGSEQLFDVIVPGLSADFAPLRSLGRTAALPVVTTPLVGREAELRTVCDLLCEPGVRLVTLAGPGGSGKTRLATAAASNLERSYADGVYFVGLHNADQRDVMWSMIGDVLDTADAPGGEPAARVTSHLAERNALLLLDNLEQIEDADVVVSSILSAAPKVKVLASSRRPLLLVGEREFPVLPLALPASSDFDDVMRSAAVEMFVQQAQMVRPSFRLTAENREAVASLCHHLDGLPLALELAAAHSRVLSPKALLTRLDGRLGTGVTAADRPTRQRTLGATIAWSYDLLADADKAVFRRLGVFRSSCDLDAVTAVAGSDGVEVLDVVTRLLSTSLIRVEEGLDGEPRVAMLETIRAFALERLGEAGEADEIRMRHLTWCVDTVERTTDLLRGTLHTVALDRLGAVDNDVRAALDFALRPAGPDEHERVAAGHELLINVTTRYWYRFGSVAEARMWQERGLEIASDEDSDANIGLLHGLGMSRLQQTEVESSVALFERSLEMARRLHNRDLEARALNDLAIARRQSGNFAAAMALLRESHAISKETGNVQYQATSLSNLVVVYIDLGDYAQAARAAEESMGANLAAGDDWGVALDRLNYTAAILKAEGAHVAYARYLEWADDFLAFRDNELLIDLMELGAAIVAGLGEYRAVAQLLAGADTQRARIPMPRSAAEEALVQEWLSPARQALSDDDWNMAYWSGTDLTPELAIQVVRSMEGVGASPPVEVGGDAQSGVT